MNQLIAGSLTAKRQGRPRSFPVDSRKTAVARVVEKESAKRGKLITQFRFFPWPKRNVSGKSELELQTTVRAWFDPAHPENGIQTDEECARQGASGEFDQRVPCPPN